MKRYVLSISLSATLLLPTGAAQRVTSRVAFYFWDWQELIKELRSVLERQETI